MIFAIVETPAHRTPAPHGRILIASILLIHRVDTNDDKMLGKPPQAAVKEIEKPHPSSAFFLLVLSSISALFADSAYLPIIAVFHPTFYLSFCNSCERWWKCIFGWIVVSLSRAVPASDYFKNGIPPMIAYVEGLVVIAVLYAFVTVAMIIQCYVWIDSDKFIHFYKDTNNCNGKHTQPNELTPLRAPTFGYSSSDVSGESEQEVQNTAGEKPENAVCQPKKVHQNSVSLHSRFFIMNFTFMHHPYISPLAFPILFTSIYQLVFRYSPIGGAGNPAMGLAQVNGLRQVASISGEISLVFWIGWLASVMAAIGFLCPQYYNREKSKCRILRGHLVTFVIVTLGMFIFGSIRERSGRGFYLHDISEWPATRAHEAPLQVSCLTRTERSRQIIDLSNKRLAAGDDLVIWSESAGQGFESPGMFEWNPDNTGAVLAATSYERIPRSRRVYNTVKMMQAGSVVASYSKNRPVPVIESYVLGGPRTPHTTEVTFSPRLATCGGGGGRGFLSKLNSANNYCTASGKPPRQEIDLKTAMAICFDFDFSYLLHEAHDADLVIGPSWYWASIGTNLWEHNIFRAIENGFTMTKCSENGISGAVDPFGRTIAAIPTLNDQIYTFELPVQKGVETLFERGGWMFGWLCVGLSFPVLLSAFVGRLVMKKKHQESLHA